MMRDQRVSPKRKSRAELVVALRDLQNLIGRIDGAYSNDRAPDRADQMQRLCKEAFEIAVAALATDPPQEPK